MCNRNYITAISALVIMLSWVNWVAAQCRNISFESPISSQAGNNVVGRMIGADFNNDGNSDLVTIGDFSDAAVISIMPGKGDGAFDNAITVLAGGGDSILYHSPLSGSAADLNKDGLLDLVIVNFRPASIQIYLGLGNFSFQLQSQFFVRVDESTRPGNATVGDLNNDGLLDIFYITGPTVSRKNGTIDFYFGNGDGSFQTEISYDGNQSNLPTGTVSTSNLLGIADLNNDGVNDIVLSTRETFPANEKVRIIAGITAGEFNFANESVITVNQGSLNYLIDINQDNIIDLIHYLPVDKSLSVRLGRNNGSFSASIQSKLRLSEIASPSLQFSDFNSDGIFDLLIFGRDNNSGSGSINIFYGQGNGRFSNKAEATIRMPISPTDVLAINLNGDNRTDLVLHPATSSSEGSTILARLNTCSTKLRR